jgi:glycosyltransferase involved in cell wall biosynthesis
MKRALIATLYNEADNVSRWWDCLMRQTVMPDEIAIVDGGSNDGTWEKLRELAKKCPVPVKLEQRHCNIARGRNRAIELTDTEIIAATDAGSYPDPEWFKEVTEPLMRDPTVEIVGGQSWTIVENDFQKFLRQFEPEHDSPRAENGVFSSSRNVAYRRRTWEEIGGYPEWLTLAGEDALFNFELYVLGRKFVPNTKAVVRWPIRSSANSYFKLCYRNAFGSGEARLHPYVSNYLRYVATTVCPLLLLLSRHRFRYLGFRYKRNAAHASGWLMGLVKGRRPPEGWRHYKGVLLSPAAQKSVSISP